MENLETVILVYDNLESTNQFEKINTKSMGDFIRQVNVSWDIEKNRYQVDWREYGDSVWKNEKTYGGRGGTRGKLKNDWDLLKW